jgi:hypothetical protein
MKTLYIRCRVTGLLILLAPVFAAYLPTNAHAEAVRLDMTPSIRLQEEYNSNVYNASTDEVSSLGTRATPGLALTFTSSDNVTLGLSASFERVWYNNSDAKNAEGDTWYFRVDSSGGWMLTPTLSIVPSVYYLNSTDSYRRSQLVPTGDPVLPPVSITNYGNTKSEDFGGGLRFDYLVSPNVTVGVGGRYGEHRTTSNDNVTVNGLEDSTQAGGDVSVTYLLSPRTKVGMLLAGNHQTFDTSPDADVYSAGAIYGYRFTELLRFDMTFGASYIRQKAGPGVPAENKTSPAGFFTLAYDTPAFQSKLYGSALYSGLSGYGQPTREGSLGLTFSGNFTREWSWNLGGAYQVSKSVFDEGSVDTTTTYATGALRYQMWQWVGLDLNGNLSHQTSSGDIGSDINNYSVLLGFTVGKPYQIY